MDSLLSQRYKSSVPVIQHFFDADKQVPIWAIFEVITLGTFGAFYKCLDARVKQAIVQELNMPSNFNSASLLGDIIFTLKDLRNAVAHNNTIFDTRFQTSTINNRLVFLLEKEVGITGLDFKYIYAYIVLITYALRKMGETKTACKHFITEFIDCTDSLRKQISPNICNQILGAQQQAHLRQLQNFISQS